MGITLILNRKEMQEGGVRGRNQLLGVQNRWGELRFFLRICDYHKGSRDLKREGEREGERKGRKEGKRRKGKVVTVFPFDSTFCRLSSEPVPQGSPCSTLLLPSRPQASYPAAPRRLQRSVKSPPATDTIRSGSTKYSGSDQHWWFSSVLILLESQASLTVSRPS